MLLCFFVFVTLAKWKETCQDSIFNALMQWKKLANSSFDPPPRHIFLGSNHSSFILGYVLPLDMHPRLLKNICSMCTHQAHMGFDLKKFFLKKSQILTEISVCAVCPQILFPNIFPWGGYIWKNRRAKYFVPASNLDTNFPLSKMSFPDFHDFCQIRSKFSKEC